MHGEFAEIDRTVVQPQEISPFLDTSHCFFSISVNFFDVRSNDPHSCQLSMDVRRWKQFERVEKDIIASDLDARDTFGMKEV